MGTKTELSRGSLNSSAINGNPVSCSRWNSFVSSRPATLTAITTLWSTLKNAKIGFKVTLLFVLYSGGAGWSLGITYFGKRAQSFEKWRSIHFRCRELSETCFCFRFIWRAGLSYFCFINGLYAISFLGLINQCRLPGLVSVSLHFSTLCVSLKHFVCLDEIYRTYRRSTRDWDSMVSCPL